MKKALYNGWRTFRAIVTVLLLIILLIPAGVYVALSLPGVNNGIRRVAEKELSVLLASPVSIGGVSIHPFSRLDLEDVAILNPVEKSDTMASIRAVRTRFEPLYFIRTGRIIVDYALLDAPAVHLRRATPESPLNIQPLLDALKGDGKEKPPVHFDLRISNVAILDGSFSYDIASAPAGENGRFDKFHVRLDSIELNAYIPRLSNEEYTIDLAHLSFRESSGFNLKSLQVKTRVTSTGAKVDALSVALPSSSLSFAPMELKWASFDKIGEALKAEKIQVSTLVPSTICPADFSFFVPALREFPEVLSVDISASGQGHEVELSRFRIFDSTNTSRLNLEITGSARANTDSLELPEINLRRFRLKAIPSDLLRRLPGRNVSPRVRSIAEVAGELTLAAEGSLSPDGAASIRADITSSLAGEASIDATARLSEKWQLREGSIECELRDVEAGALTGNKDLGELTATVNGTARFGRGRYPAGDVAIDVEKIRFRGSTLGDISLACSYDGKSEGDISLSSANAALDATIDAVFSTGTIQIVPALLLTGHIDSFRPEILGISVPHPDSEITASIQAELEGRNYDTMSGHIELDNIRWKRSDGEPLVVPAFSIEAAPHSAVPYIRMASPVISGEITGPYSFRTLAGDIRELVAEALPSLVKPKGYNADSANRFAFDFTIHDATDIADFFNAPVVPVYPIEISGYVSAPQGLASATIDAPFLRQGNKLIQNTTVHATLERPSGKAEIFASTEMPTKKGQMQIDLKALAERDRVDAHTDWAVKRTIPINGSIDLSALLSCDEENQLGALVNLNPGSITFGEDVWNIRPATIDYRGNEIDIRGFRLDASGQEIAADGRVGQEETDAMTLSLKNVSLLPIFETLEIDNALIGGRATGVFRATRVLSPEPQLQCDDLRVDSIGYNRCTLGNAHIAAGWDNSTKAFTLDADIVEPEKDLHSRIYGSIFPLTESLDINFHAQHVRVGFMQTFMSAFASHITGYAWGDARLYGTFKEIDMTGRIFAEDLGLNIDITNTRYTASDTIVLQPGLINLEGIELHDINGHTARLSGYLRHTFFKAPVFDFRVTDAREFQCFNGTPKQNPDWYGTVYGNGGATIQGQPGVVNIGAEMTTTAGSHFTFVLSDRLDAEDYTFITFRDVTPANDSLRKAASVLPEAVLKLMKRNDTNVEAPSAYNMDIQVNITPEARMTLVMDPVGGDEIRAYGEGNMRLTYQSLDNSINMWGNYTLERGSYNFTLQDIIIKDFTIKPGSTISFTGDPYGAIADLQAYYAVNANLSDLDENFLQDKELNRTNVPVHALMKVTGDIRQPDIDFDLEFPTLTQDTYRKVRSIVSTSDMMNRQIIYLLALNRFYTPDYMASTTKGSELFSVASSTIASQLSSMLGKLSENWSIAPNLRSDRGDFSDVEVDVALSSRLLNNRLLFNGNFGYRDKSLNTNQFVGDFDIEYLLNKRGSWRLKAYNRYNDQNYYLRTAQTTQGVGIMFRKDFDNLFSFLRKNRSKATNPDTITPASESLKEADNKK